MFHFEEGKIPQDGYTTPLVTTPSSGFQYKSMSGYVKADHALCLECWSEDDGHGEKAHVYIPAKTVTKLVAAWLVYRIRLRLGFQ